MSEGRSSADQQEKGLKRQGPNCPKSRADPTRIVRLAIGSSWQPGVEVLLLVQVVIVAFWIMRYLDQSLPTSVQFAGKALFHQVFVIGRVCDHGIGEHM